MSISNLGQSCDSICNSVEFPTSSQTVTQEEVDNAAVNILNALGATTCTYSQTVDEEAATSVSEAGISWVKSGIFKSATSGATDTDTYSVGCENITVTAIKYVQTKRSIMNVLNCSCTNINQQTSAINSITFESFNSKILCNIDIDQNIVVKNVVSSNITDTMKTEIQKVTTDLMTYTVDQLISTDTELSSTPEGNKTVTSIYNEINSDEVSNTIKYNISQMLQSVTGQNNLVIKIHDTIMEGTTCKFHQNIILELIATNIINSAMTTLANLTSTTQAITDIKNEQNKKSTGIAEVTEKRGDTLEKILKNTGFSFSFTNIKFILILIFIIGFIIMMVIFKRFIIYFILLMIICIVVTLIV